MNQITVFIADNHQLIRQILCSYLNYDNRFVVIGDAENDKKSIDLAQSLRPDVFILAAQLASDCKILLKEIKHYSPQTRIIVISRSSQVNAARDMIEAGAAGYLTNYCPGNELTSAILEVNKGNLFLSSQIKKRIIKEGSNHREQEAKINLLTRKELDIAGLVRSGYSSRQIAEKLMLSVKTIEVHRYNILKKLNLRNTASLVNFMSVVS